MKSISKQSRPHIYRCYFKMLKYLLRNSGKSYFFKSMDFSVVMRIKSIIPYIS